MKRVLLSGLAVLMLASAAVAQERARSNATLRRDAVDRGHESDSDVRMTHVAAQTPEMWFYEQERSRWEDPQAAVRRKAEIKAAQRADRMASAKWYGMSNSPPSANITPLFGTYSPSWVSNSWDPNRWTTARDTANTTIIVR